MVGKKSLDVLELCDKASEFAIKGHKVGSFDLCKYEVNVLVEVGAVDLHRAYRKKIIKRDFINSSQRPMKVATPIKLKQIDTLL